MVGWGASIPSRFMTQFLTVKEAARLTGKSTSSIRRVIYPIIHDDQHPDRREVQPDIEQVQQLRVKGENFAWRLSEELLRREIPVGESAPSQAPKAGEGSPAPGDGGLVAMLRAELAIKNQQIENHSQMLTQQMEILKGLSERMHEGNVLIGALQQQLRLPAARSRPTPESRDAKPGKPAMQEKGSKPSAKPAPAKRGLFERLFG